MAKVKAGISRLTSTGLVEKAGTIVTSMTGNPAYASLQTLLPPISAAADDLAAANQAAKFNGGKKEHEQRRVSEAALRTLINNLVPQVQTASGGVAEVILSAGFDTVKRPEHHPAPNEPQKLEALLTAYEGSIKLRWATDKHADYYQVELVDDKEVFEVVATTTRANHMLTGLESGRKYTIRVVAVNTAGTSPASEPIIAKAA